MSQAPEDPSHLIALAKLLLSEVVEEGLDHVDVSQVDGLAAAPAETSPAAAKTAPRPASSVPSASPETITPPPEVTLAANSSLASVRETLGDCQRCPFARSGNKSSSEMATRKPI